MKNGKDEIDSNNNRVMERNEGGNEKWHMRNTVVVMVR